jgi:SAM-dependent methyltransferase
MRFNWPQYAAGCASIALLILVLILIPMPPGIIFVLLAGIIAAGWWTFGSLIASYWIYDASELTRWTWLCAHLDGGSHQRLLNIHSGFDSSTSRLSEVFPQARLDVVDLYDPGQMTEPSIHRARQAVPPRPGTLAARPDSLPFASESFDGAFLLFAAHELRSSPDREALFLEVRRVLKREGRAVLVEHARDVANFMAFGPGFLHFLPFGEWLRLARGVGLNIVHAIRITPFVRVLVIGRN